jgi:Flp pilus assembly protein TadB
LTSKRDHRFCWKKCNYFLFSGEAAGNLQQTVIFLFFIIIFFEKNKNELITHTQNSSQTKYSKTKRFLAHVTYDFSNEIDFRLPSYEENKPTQRSRVHGSQTHFAKNYGCRCLLFFVVVVLVIVVVVVVDVVVDIVVDVVVDVVTGSLPPNKRTLIEP